MIYIRGVMLQPKIAGLATVENLCNVLPKWFIQKTKARARCSGLIPVCPESLLSLSRIPTCPESLLGMLGTDWAGTDWAASCASREPPSSPDPKILRVPGR